MNINRDITRHQLIIIAGPNGAGKSTTAPSLLKETLAVKEFVNADLIAQGISAFKPEMSAFQAGRVMLERLHYLSKNKIDFAFETTLASKTFAPWIAKLKTKGYKFNLIFLYLPNENFAVSRVAERVHMGGHNVPDETIRRRYRAGLHNFFNLYMPLVDTWRFYDNSVATGPKLIASGHGKKIDIIENIKIWNKIIRRFKK